MITLGQEVVWLTTQETLTATPAYIDHLRHHLGEEDAKPFIDANILLLENDTRLTVKIPTPNKKLVRYQTWLNTTNIVGTCAELSVVRTGRDVAAAMNLPLILRKSWWIYFGTIKPSNIEIPMVRDMMLPGRSD